MFLLYWQTGLHSKGTSEREKNGNVISPLSFHFEPKKIVHMSNDGIPAFHSFPISRYIAKKNTVRQKKPFIRSLARSFFFLPIAAIRKYAPFIRVLHAAG